MSDLPPYVPRDVVAERLPLIFPEGTPQRGYVTREMAASTVFAMLYIGAVEGTGRYLGPIHVYVMTEEHAVLEKDADRIAYAKSPRKAAGSGGTRWYEDNTREPIRDETLREGLVEVGAVVGREDLPTTSGKPRYAMRAAFAALFDLGLQGDELQAAIAAFQAKHLSKAALARVRIVSKGAAASKDQVLVTLPNGTSRALKAGPSSIIAKAVVEEFAPRFLEEPALLWLSESGNKVAVQDDALASAVGFAIQADRDLPDLILVDLGGDAPLFVFVEVVATDGPVSERRKAKLLELMDGAGLDQTDAAFVTAYKDRAAGAATKTMRSLAWGSFAWFASEPNRIVRMVEKAELLRKLR